MWVPWKTSSDREKQRKGLLRCSFCGKSSDQVEQLLAGPTVYICNECVDLCNDLVEDWDKRGSGMAAPPTNEVARERSATASAMHGLRCSLCRMPGPRAEFLLIPDRGPLCFVCRDVILAAIQEAHGAAE
jgi:hypothetical protein